MRQNRFKISKNYRAVVNVFLFIFNKIFRLKGNITPEIKNLTGPYLLLANHIGTYDPFLISYFLKTPPHFVSSDAIMRDPVFGFLFKKFGVIPKKKNVRDTQVIRDMLTVTKSGGAIGLFPEGSRSWTGTSLHIEPSLAKLVKLLNIPVVIAKTKGLHLTNPRWSYKLRRSAIDIDYKLSFSQEEISKATPEDILSKIRADLFHDEVNYQRVKRNKIKSNSRADYISHVLFYCPSCKGIGKIASSGNNFECKNCGQKTHINAFGFFEKIRGKTLPFDNIRDWFDWQRVSFEKFIQSHLRKQTYAPLFTDENMTISQEFNGKLQPIGSATILFYINRILLKFDDGKNKEFRLDDIQTLNPQLRERIEMIYKNQYYRFTGKKPGVSGLKWEIAVNAIWQLTDQGFKQSTYLVN